MKKLYPFILCFILMACNDEQYLVTDNVVGQTLRFAASVIEQPEKPGAVVDTDDPNVTKDFKAGDSFGLFIIDGGGNLVTEIEGHNARNIKVTTPDGTAWNVNSDISEVVHKLGYSYVAYYPYTNSEGFNNCPDKDKINDLLTAPAEDQSEQPATDWMITEPSKPEINAVTTLKFKHKYAKIDIYNSFTQEHTNDWASLYKFTKTVDDNNVEHYRYILNVVTPHKMSVSGKYSIGDKLTGIKQFTYNRDDVAIENGRHSIVYTYGMDERCAIDLGFPSGVKWSPINLGTEKSTYLDEPAIAAAGKLLGKRLAWGELYEKDIYTSATYIDYPDQNGKVLLPEDISETVYDPVKQYWGGHWMLPNVADLQEFVNNTEVVKTETVYSEDLGKDINKITFRSKCNGKEITFLSNGYAYNSTVSANQYLYYMSAIRSNAYYCNSLVNSSGSIKVDNTYINRYWGYSIRPVLKEYDKYTNDEKKALVTSRIDDLAVDLGIRKTVKEIVDGVEQDVTYKVLWSPFNYGAETKVELNSINGVPVDEDAFVNNDCFKSPGMRLAWGDVEERAKFSTADYKNSAIAAKYNYNNTTTTDLDTRDLKYKDDIIQLNWPTGWYMPTARDLQLLINNTTVSTTTIDGHRWIILTGKGDYSGVSIQIPAAGFIDDAVNESWPRNAGTAYLQSATIGLSASKPTIYALYIGTSSGNLITTAGRPTGLNVRPVKYVKVSGE